MKKPIISLLLCVFVSQTNAGIRQYGADLEHANWQLTNNSRLECTLSHQIPNYGEAKFYSTANRKMNMEFELDMMRLPDTYSLAEVRSVAPNWRPGKSGRTIADMKLYKQFAPSLPKKVAWNMLNELEQGMNPTFYYNDWYSENERISVGISTAKFNRVYQEFIGCVGNLLNYNFDDISYTVLNYQFGGDSLTKSSKKRLSMIAEYLTLDNNLELVLIDGYTDSYGGRNDNLKVSNRRANTIREHFVKNGIDPSRIEAKGYGEKRHIASNNTIIGRAQNRRVVIRME
ncbi:MULTISPECIES: flagellar protein MotY [unclassified Colwellia]|uniref:flagellar protein MotY n=1 Tax=unclassified Colwellia TaxID=196834 RepID=UPI0015F601A3|nr:MULTISPECIES: OmpA family protein [unclassified Colwellia]MBA6231953.1 OmpA family protein [Colwellia sp. MB02u-7]MBA6235874.1 OmpA family protein [Colwellia sp. MB02u-11]MBA6255290.1 OmpA family protein [Colwellia sp. MB3u-28]MBA6258545.1 OmpA family protein [Colwellia sp. MB3u-41]MBA6298711.1 OmpA family protein [Colwellia sp. MB3u-22]